VPRETLLLVDGHALVYRAFFAMPSLTNGRGELINAVYGFTSMLLKAVGEHHPQYAVACFDLPGPTFRHEEMPEYKAQRPEMPSELRPQLGLSRDVVAALGIPTVELPGFEADDVIGSLARQAEARGLDVLILTGDLDALQLVTEHVNVYATRRGLTDTIVYDIEKVHERYGFAPPGVVDFKALQGDVSDNIPGVPGIGEKTAKQLVGEYGSLEAVLEALPSMKEGRVKRALTEHREQAILSKRMATIRTEIDVPLELEAARLRDYDRENARTLFLEIGMPSLVARLPEPAMAAAAGAGTGQMDLLAPPAAPPVIEGVEVTLVTDADIAGDMVERLRDAREVCLRTVAEEPARRGRVAGVVLSTPDGEAAWYISIGHGDSRAPDAALQSLHALLADESVPKLAHDLKREILIWRAQGVKFAGHGFDLMLAAYLTNTRVRVPGVTLLAHDYLNVNLEPEEDIFRVQGKRRGLGDIPAAEAAQHFGARYALMGLLRDALQRELAQGSLRQLYQEMELPLIPILAEMEWYGIRIDSQHLAEISAELHTRIGELELEVQDMAGAPFNLGSTQQLAKVLYEDLGLAAGRKTKTGRSTDADSLEGLRDEHPIVGSILEWRQLSKLKSTYVDALPLLADADGRLHTSFNQAVAATGRLSSSDPNLQNIPVRTEWGQRIRDAFRPEPGQLLVSADYSQIELRVLAHVSGDEALIEAFQRGEDIHRATAAEVAGVPLEAVTPELRRNAKVVNFGVLYGLSDFGLARDTGMSREDARAYIDAYFTTFAAVSAYLDTIRNHAREWGYVETMFGRRRHIPDMRAANRQIRGAAERMAINMPIQGAAADIMKMGMIRTDGELQRRGLRARVLLQVHDELLLEATEDEVDELAALVVESMSGAAQLVVPLDVDVKVGASWQQMRPLEVAAAGGHA
jgi:DNA polymerase-1